MLVGRVGKTVLVSRLRFVCETACKHNRGQVNLILPYRQSAVVWVVRHWLPLLLMVPLSLWLSGWSRQTPSR